MAPDPLSPLDRSKRFLVTTRMWSLEYAQQLQNKPNDPATKTAARPIIRELVFHMLLVFACVWMLFGLLWDIAEPGGMWFQRSGAVLVAAAIASEYFSTPSHSNWIPPLDGHARLQAFFRRFGFLAIVLGTVVWAYGDLLFQNAM